MSIITKQKLLNTISAHPKLVTLGIGLALTLSIGTVLGMFGVHTAIAKDCPQHGCKGTHGYSNQHIIFAIHQHNHASQSAATQTNTNNGGNAAAF